MKMPPEVLRLSGAFLCDFGSDYGSDYDFQKMVSDYRL